MTDEMLEALSSLPEGGIYRGLRELAALVEDATPPCACGKRYCGERNSSQAAEGIMEVVAREKVETQLGLTVQMFAAASYLPCLLDSWRALLLALVRSVTESGSLVERELLMARLVELELSPAPSPAPDETVH